MKIRSHNPSVQIEDWKAPQWHQDLGDAERELQILKKYAMALRDKLEDLEFVLDAYEPGYMRVVMMKSAEEIGELVVVDAEQEKVGLLLNSEERDDESYFTEVEGAVEVVEGFVRR